MKLFEVVGRDELCIAVVMEVCEDRSAERTPELVKTSATNSCMMLLDLTRF